MVSERWLEQTPSYISRRHGAHMISRPDPANAADVRVQSLYLVVDAASVGVCSHCMLCGEQPATGAYCCY